MMMGSTERRIACLKIAAQMNRRVTRDDPVMTSADLIAYAEALSEFAYRGEGRSADLTNGTKATS